MFFHWKPAALYGSIGSYLAANMMLVAAASNASVITDDTFFYGQSPFVPPGMTFLPISLGRS
jgi:hypothetical protein